MTIDERVERVMKSLGGAAVPTGLEARVLARVAAARGERRSVGSGWVWGAAVAAGMLLTIGLGLHGRRPEGPVKVAVAARPAGTVGSEGAPHRQKSVARTGEYRTARVVPVIKARPAIERANVGATAQRLESFPAPPEPLTEQEKLLVKVARNGDRGNDFELLDPETVDVAFAEEDAETAEMVKQGRPAPMKGEYWKRTQHN